MEMQTIEWAVWAQRYHPSESYKYTVWCGAYDMSDQGYIKADSGTLTFKPLGFEEGLQKEIEQLRKAQTKVRADAEREATQIEQKIQSLLAISYSPTPLAPEALPESGSDDDIPF